MGKKKILAYTVETMGMYFWQSNLDVKEDRESLERLSGQEVILAEDAKNILSKGLLRMLIKSGVLHAFRIVLDSNCNVKVESEITGGE